MQCTGEVLPGTALQRGQLRPGAEHAQWGQAMRGSLPSLAWVMRPASFSARSGQPAALRCTGAWLPQGDGRADAPGRLPRRQAPQEDQEGTEAPLLGGNLPGCALRPASAPASVPSWLHPAAAPRPAPSRPSWAAIAGAKLFYLSGMRNGKYLQREVLNLARFIAVQKFRPLTWRQAHPFLLADRFEVRRSPPDSSRRLQAPVHKGAHMCLEAGTLLMWRGGASCRRGLVTVLIMAVTIHA